MGKVLIEPPNGSLKSGTYALNDNRRGVGNALKAMLKSGAKSVGRVRVSLLCGTRELHNGEVWSKDSDRDGVRGSG